MFGSPECTDYTLRRLEKSGIADRVRSEIFPEFRKDHVVKVECLRPSFRGGRDREVEWTASRLGKRGKSTKQRLGLTSGEAYGFDSVTGFHRGLGAFVVGEYEPERPIGFRWRGKGRKTGIWNGMGEAMIIQQDITDPDESLWPYQRLFTHRDAQRQVHANLASWPEMLGVALLYYQKVNPDKTRAEVKAFAGEHFRDYETPFDRALFAECQTDAEIANTFVPPPGLPTKQDTDLDGSETQRPLSEPAERRSRLHFMALHQLTDLFSKGIPNADQGPIMPTFLPSSDSDRFGFVYTKGDDLHIGIREDTVYPRDDALLDHHVEVLPGSMLDDGRRIRDWIRFTPEDASDLLRAVLAQYSRDRWQVPEILDLYEWGMDLATP